MRVLGLVLLLSCLIGCGGDNYKVIRCFSGGQQVAEYTTPNLLWVSGARIGFDLEDGREVITTGGCISEEK
jgi:hypothetical protein